MAAGEGKVLPNRNVKPGVFGLGMVLKEIHLAYSTWFLFREYDLYLQTGSWSPLICTEKAFGSGYMGLHECIYFIIFVYHVNIKVFHFIYFSLFLFIYMFPFCLHATSALHKPITILFCIIMHFWIFDILLKFWYVLDVSYWNDVKTTWKRRVHVVSTRNKHEVFVGTLLEVSSPLTVLSKSNRLIYYFY